MLVVCFMLPMRAQYSDGFFRNNDLYIYRDGGESYYNLTNQHFGDVEYGGYNLYNQHFGADAPLGGGLLIMFGAGTCYAMLKRKQK